MYDLSKIDKPFGELTPPVQEALKEYARGGGKVQFKITAQGWNCCPFPNWLPSLIYRADPDHYTAEKWEFGMPAAYRRDPFTEVDVVKSPMRANQAFPLVAINNNASPTTHTIDGELFADAGTEHDLDLVPLQTKPARQPSVDWSHVGPEIDHFSFDKDGRVWGSSHKPYVDGIVWASNAAVWHDVSGLFASYDPGDVDWQDSLISRPGHEGDE